MQIELYLGECFDNNEGRCQDCNISRSAGVSAVLCCVALQYPHLADWRRASEMWSNRLRPRFPFMCELDGVVTARVHVLLCYGGSGLWRQRASLTIASRLVLCTWTSGPRGVYSVREFSEG